MNHKVLVFNSELLENLGKFQGFTLNVEKYISEILNPKNNFFLDRNKAEQSPEYKQLIIYVVLRFKNSFFTYTRGSQSGEKRLTGLRSIALGGHVEQIDKKRATSDRKLYHMTAMRELKEEVVIKSDYFEHIVALINDDSNEVGKVHFGVLHIWDLLEPNVTKKEEMILEEGFIPLQKLKKLNNFESWSQITLKILEEPQIPPYKYT